MKPKRAATVLAMMTGVAALSPSLSWASTAQSAQAVADAGTRIASVAAQVCQYPEMAGYSRGVDGQLTGTLNTSKLLRGLAQAGISANVKGGLTSWKGVLQKDAASAHNVSAECASQVFGLMWRTFSLRDAQSGAPIKPSKLNRKSLVTGSSINPKERPSGVTLPSPPEFSPPFAITPQSSAGSSLAPGARIRVAFQGSSMFGISLLVTNEGDRAGSLADVQVYFMDESGAKGSGTSLTLVTDGNQRYAIGQRTPPIFLKAREGRYVLGLLSPILAEEKATLFKARTCRLDYISIDDSGTVQPGRTSFECFFALDAVNGLDRLYKFSQKAAKTLRRSK